MTAPRTLGELLFDAAQRHGDRIAFTAPGGQLTYGALWERSAGLAAALADAGVRPGDRVAICFSKSPELPVAIFGALLTGAAYVPIDYTAPASRAQQLIADAEAAALVCDGRAARRFLGAGEVHEEHGLLAFRVTSGGSGEIAATSIQPTVAAAAAQFPIRGLSPQSLAYILYTSGSTGRPKGVCQSHESALAFVNWSVEHLQLHSGDVLSQHAAPTFDLSVFDFFAAAAVGAELVAVPEWLYGSVARLCRFIADAKISIWYSVPSALLRPFSGRPLEVLRTSALRRVVFAGEVLPKGTLRMLAEALPAGCRIENWYGPTETNVCTYFEIDAESLAGDGPIPIGAACPYASLELVEDATGESELLVSGATVMAGYWRRPDATASVLRTSAGGKSRTYRTGDWVTGARDRLVYVGRRDRMLKVRGYRVQPEEVESCLRAHPAVVEAAVFVGGETGDRLLAAVVANRSPAPIDELRRFCAEKLPAYMVPADVIALDELSRTDRGKVDLPAVRARILSRAPHAVSD
ncbi:MAG TPA: amino acid adenylation domain-containing protein [Thermoanaerobaculia bacterium]